MGKKEGRKVGYNINKQRTGWDNMRVQDFMCIQFHNFHPSD
jgi:hypothetical protein